MPKLSTLPAACAALAAALCAAPAWSAPPVYNVVMLPLLKGDPASQSSVPEAVNKNGDIVGYIDQYISTRKQTTKNSFGVIWPADGSAPIKLKTPQPERPNDNVIPWAINNARSVAGMSVDYNGNNHFPERWLGRRSVEALQTPGFGQALAIGEDNVTGGYTQITEKYDDSQPTSTFAVATIWAADGTPTTVGTMPGFINGINASGYMLGSFQQDTGVQTPFVRDPAANLMYLQDLPGQTPRALYAWAFNDHNEVVGHCDQPGATQSGQVACLWSANGMPTDLGRINDGNIAERYEAWGINNSRQVVGYYGWYEPSHQYYYVTYTYWSDETGLVDITKLIDPADPLLPAITAAFDNGGFNVRTITDGGVVVGSLNGKAFKLVPKK